MDTGTNPAQSEHCRTYADRKSCLMCLQILVRPMRQMLRIEVLVKVDVAIALLSRPEKLRSGMFHRLNYK